MLRSSLTPSQQQALESRGYTFLADRQQTIIHGSKSNAYGSDALREEQLESKIEELARLPDNILRVQNARTKRATNDKGGYQSSKRLDSALPEVSFQADAANVIDGISPETEAAGEFPKVFGYCWQK
uniref:Uncharacterized protein n=1 Tax=Ditylenchus dipsaci TaxID=166011 RepID=A0A915DU65_9BILA